MRNLEVKQGKGSKDGEVPAKVHVLPIPTQTDTGGAKRADTSWASVAMNGGKWREWLHLEVCQDELPRKPKIRRGDPLVGQADTHKQY